MVKIFAHRGFVQNNIKQNSIASLKNAFNNGFKAIEFDIWWVENDLFLSHDKPSKSQLFSLPRFNDYFIYGNQIDYWLDFKNLDEHNIDDVLRAIKINLELHKVDLTKIYFAPYITNYHLVEMVANKFRNFFDCKINFMGVCDNKIQIPIIADLLDLDVIDYVSIDHRLIEQSTLDVIDAKKIFAWTINDIKIFNDLMIKGINNFATDVLVI